MTRVTLPLAVLVCPNGCSRSLIERYRTRIVRWHCRHCLAEQSVERPTLQDRQAGVWA